MIIIYHRQFLKHFQKRISPNIKLKERFSQRVKLFNQDPSFPQLFDHPLEGDYEGYRSFSITGDIRIIYKRTESEIIFIDIGTHNQLYGE